MSGDDPFRRSTVAALAAVGGTGLLLMLLYGLFGPRAAGGDPAAAALGRSALGYRALVRLLELEVPVEPAHGVLPPSASAERPLLVLDPTPAEIARLRETVARASARGVPVVVVLPKWSGEADANRPGWLAAVELREPAAAAAALAAAVGNEPAAAGGGGPAPAAEAAERDGPRLEVVRPRRVDAWQVDLDGAAGLVPDLPRPQLFLDRAGYFVPLVASAEGILVGRAKDLPVYVVADPDLVNVAGLGRGDNAVLAHRLLVDEVAPRAWLVRAGSFGALPPVDSIWRGLLRPPLVAFSAQLAAVALLLAWVAAERFGRPRRPPLRVAPGKRTLVDNTARLLAAAGDAGEALQRYLDLVARRCGERLGLPAGLEPRQRLHRLDRIGARRGTTRGTGRAGGGGGRPAAAGRRPPPPRRPGGGGAQPLGSGGLR